MNGPPGSLLLGNLTDFRRDLLGWLTMCAKEYGDFVPARLAIRRGYLVSGPELVADVLVRRHQDFRKVFLLRNNRLFLGRGLLTSEGEWWKRNRKLVQPHFHPATLDRHGAVMVAEAKAWWKNGIVDVQEEMATLTLPILVRNLFGTADVDVRRVARALDVIQDRMKQRYQALVPLPDTAWTPRNIRLRRAVRDLDHVVGPLVTGSMSRDEVMTMLFAGHETTALTLAWTWHLLAQHPEQEEKLHVELDAVLGGRAPSTADLPRLGAVTRIVKEVMRLYPPVYAFGRDAVRDTELGGHRVPRGASVIVAPWVLHRDPRFFAAPGEFRPERWTPEFERALPRHAYLPFGGGARMCLGKGFAMNEAVLVIASLAQRFRFTPLPGHRVELWPTFTLRSRHGLPMRVAER